jgi:hypothetical protein
LTLGLWRYVPQVLGTAAASIVAVNYLSHRRTAVGRGAEPGRLRRQMLISGVIGLVTMAVAFVFLEWFNHAVVHPHRFMTHTDYASALVPGVPNARLLYAMAATFIGVGLLWGLPFQLSEGAEPPTSRRRIAGVAVSLVAAIALLTLVIGTFPGDGSTRSPGGPVHMRQHK